MPACVDTARFQSNERLVELPWALAKDARAAARRADCRSGMTALGTLEQAARELSELFRPLEDRFAADGIEGTLAYLGLRVPP